MSGYQENPLLWRLKTSSGLPYKVKGMSGGFDPDVGSINVQVIIHATNLNEFLEFIFPEPVQLGYLLFPRATALPGIPEMVATSLTFKAFDEAMPIDPFGFDPSAPAGTYYNLIELDIKYDTRVKQKQPTTDPKTFLEISSNASGEFLHTSMPNAHYTPITNNNVDTDGDGVGDIPDSAILTAYEGPGDQLVGTYVDPDTGETVRGTFTIYSDEVIKDPTVPVMIMIPTTEFTVRYPQIDYDYFYSVFVHRLDAAMGKVNLKQIPWLPGGTERGTVLFMGYSHTEKSTWRSGKINKPPVTVEMKMMRKRVLWEGTIRGHNDVWRPGKGWERLKMKKNPDKFMYEEWDMTRLFKIV